MKWVSLGYNQSVGAFVLEPVWENPFFAFSAPRGSHSLPYGPFLHLQSQQPGAESFAQRHVSASPSSASLPPPLGRTLWSYPAHLDTQGTLPMGRSAISNHNSTCSLLPLPGTHLYIPGIRTWASLGDHYTTCHTQARKAEATSLLQLPSLISGTVLNV